LREGSLKKLILVTETGESADGGHGDRQIQVSVQSHCPDVAGATTRRATREEEAKLQGRLVGEESSSQ
jgi:hypothetical protein